MRPWRRTSVSALRPPTRAAGAPRSPNRHVKRGRAIVTDTKKRDEELTEEELEKAHAERLPEREQMSVIREPFPIGVDPIHEITIQPVPPTETS
jgi:hypothetical protein